MSKISPLISFGSLCPFFCSVIFGVSLVGCNRQTSNLHSQSDYSDSQISNSSGVNSKITQRFPKIELRGFGTVSAEFWDLSKTGHNASVLRINCEDEQKADLTLAKYLSDLTLLPGVQKEQVKTGADSIPACKVNEQGSVAAYREGSAVYVVSTDSASDIGAVINYSITGDPKKRSFIPKSEVPMWLDRWDKFGFRFYYSRPFLTPPDKTPETYDVGEEFQFAKRLGRPGFLFWNSTFDGDTAEGLTTENRWNWAMEECKRLELPVGMQLIYTPQMWLANRFREQTMQKMPGFVGDRFDIVSDFDGGPGMPSWCAKEMGQVLRSSMQESVRKWNNYPNITSWNHPDCEFQHGFDQMMEYGPFADASYQAYLKEQYAADLKSVAKRWTGNPEGISSWADIKVPEFAAFSGWGPQALDLTGDWKVKFCNPYVDGKQLPAPADWLSVEFDDSSWPTFPAPGHDRGMFLLKDDNERPKWSRQRFQQAVYRRTFELPSDWKTQNPRTWLYVWDLNVKWGAMASAYLNGLKAGESLLRHGTRHWFAMEVTDLLHSGRNQLSLVLPDGSLGYRVYLSPTPPAQHPYFDEHINEQWVDFTGWLQWSRLKALEENVAMIRDIDPNRDISFMDKNGFAFWRDGTKRLCVEYGGEIHNTGYMGGIWADDVPMLSRSSGLPSSVEPGEPAGNPENLLNLLGLYSVEGIQGIDYFQHISDILWPDGIRKTFEENWKLFELVGKYHSPRADVAILLGSNRWNMCEYTAAAVFGDANANLNMGFWDWNASALFFPAFDRDAVSPYDFEDGNAEKYKVIVDTNTSIMDEKLVKGIERYVRDGGIFVTYVQTGRHTPTKADTWPISRLTGYQVTGIDEHDSDGNPKRERSLSLVPGQSVFSEGKWRSAPKANGLSLKKEADDAVDLMEWEDGSVAIGMRPIGKGYVIQVGPKFASTSQWRGRPEWMASIFEEIFDHFNIARVPVTISGVDNSLYSNQAVGSVPPSNRHARPLIYRRYVSNNGLYDVWTLWNSTKAPASITFDPQVAAGIDFCFEAKTGRKLPIGDIRSLKFSPLETKVFLIPRNRLINASSDWFALQCDWWRGTKKITAEPLPKFEAKFALDLSPDWNFFPSPSSEQVSRIIDGKEPTGEKRRLGIWGLADHQGVEHAVFEKQITIPGNWKDGEVRLWFLVDYGQANVTYVPAFLGEAKISLDGKTIRDFSPLGMMGVKIPGLEHGSSHRLTIEIKGKSKLLGLKGGAWLNFVPKPSESISLAGLWKASDDALTFGKELTFPGEWDAYLVRRKIEIPDKFRGKNVVVHLEFDGEGPQGVVINGKWMRKSFQNYGSRLDFNITPWVKFGEENEIELAYVSDGRGQGPGKFNIKHVSLDIFEPQVFP